MDTSNDPLTKRSGTLVFDLTCRLLCSNHDGRVLFMGEDKAVPTQASPDIAFDVKRLCFRLKKLADSVETDGATLDKRQVPSIAATSSDQRYRLEGSLLMDETTKRTCLLVKVQNE